MFHPQLEPLESRLSPSALPGGDHGFSVFELQAPAWVTSELALNESISFQLFLQQFHLGLPGLPTLPTGSNVVLRVDITQQQWATIAGFYPYTTFRETLPAGLGQVPLFVVPDVDGMSQGIDWELSCFAKGWWFYDPSLADDPGYDHALIPPGPQHGMTFTPPTFLWADLALAAGDPGWWLFV